MESKNYALWLLGRRAYTVKKLREKLSNKQYPEADIAATIKFCIDQHFLDDVEYAKNFIRARDAIRPRGRRILKFELIRKGVASADIDKAFEDEEISNRDERELALRIVERKSKQCATLSKEVAYRRLFGTLARRGFDINIIKEVINEYFANRNT
jgi:regulatory protein